MKKEILGNLLMTIAVAVQSYFTSWVLIGPSLEESNPLKKIYPCWCWAAFAPISLFLLFIFGVVMFVKSDGAPPVPTAQKEKVN